MSLKIVQSDPPKFNRERLVKALAIAQADLWEIAYREANGGVYTEEGYIEIARHASESIDDALSALGIDDITKEPGGDLISELQIGDVPNWNSWDYDHLRVPAWRDDRREGSANSPHPKNGI